MKLIGIFLFFISIFFIYSDDLHELYIDRTGKAHAGLYVKSLLPLEDPIIVLLKYLKKEQYNLRKDGFVTYISPLEEKGYIPILSFHKLGENESFEISKENLIILLKYLNGNSFHIISDQQFITQDYTYAISDKKLIVLGIDDASKGVFYYKTTGDLKTDLLLTEDNRPVISDESMIYYLDKYIKPENGRRNITFYVTFDAIPFRQTGGENNPGFPYKGMSVVKLKLDYLFKNYYIGNHTLSHYYSERLNETDFIAELDGFYQIMESYGINISHIKTLAYSYGIGNLSEKREETVRSYYYNNTSIIGAFDYNGYLSHPLSSSKTNLYDISRIGVDNKSFMRVMYLLKNEVIFRSKRIVLFESLEYPFDLESLELNEKDSNYIVIRN